MKHRSLSNIERLVERWQPRLGLGHWHIEVRRTVNPFDDESTAMEIEQHPNAHRAAIRVADWLLDGGEDRLDIIDEIDADFVEKTVVHELLHLHFRDLRQVWDEFCEEEVAGQTKAVLQQASTRAEEGAVDMLARALVRAFADLS